MTIKPTGYHVLIKQKVVEKKTDGGIILTESTVNREQAAMTVGTVLAFGPACFRNMECGVNGPEDWGVKVGDKVKYPKYVGMKLEDEMVLIVDHEIKAVVTEETER